MIVWFLLLTVSIQNQRENDDNDDGFFHIPAPPPAPNLAHEGAGPTIVPEGDNTVHAPEGVFIPPALTIGQLTCGAAWQYPPA